MNRLRFLALPCLLLWLSSGHALAAEPPLPEKVATIATGLDTVWVLVAAFLVFFMQAGFGMVEAGFIRAKNTCNILTKNFLDYCVASIMFLLVGYAFMFGKGGGLIGLSGFGLPADAPNPSGVPLYAFWLFQAAFCGAAATIVAGGMAERMKFPAYLVYTVFISGLVYPIIGHWVWSSDGWLAAKGFADFAGSTVVHATGGWAAFIGAYLVGPRIGKYVSNGQERHVAAISGSTLGVGDGSAIGRVAINTNLSAATGAIVAMVTVWLLYGKPDLSMTMNGALAGLVAITAPCAFVSPAASLAIGAVAGVVVVCGVALLDRIGVDDPVGAVAVHGMNGIWGTLAVGLWGQKALGVARDGLFAGGGLAQLGVQALGACCVTLFAVGSMGLVFLVIKKTLGLRVSKDEELRGLDIGEHGMEAYAGFQVFTTT